MLHGIHIDLLEILFFMRADNFSNEGMNDKFGPSDGKLEDITHMHMLMYA